MRFYKATRYYITYIADVYIVIKLKSNYLIKNIMQKIQLNFDSKQTHQLTRSTKM